MGKPLTELTPEMVDILQGKTVVLLQAVEPESQTIYSTALSWVYAIDQQTIRYAIDHKSQFIRILEENPNIVLHFIGCESVFRVAGKAKLRAAKAEDVSINLALIEVKVEEVRDIIFFGGKITTDPAFIKTYDEKLIEKLDREVGQAIHRL
ncbi:Pyridoxamine 5'-phosphate oxidase [Seinonella peptonophila]|uniref:Pyridoxamine 5'-phosphate oxidase n=1 Tax=Seinonella peptonophila TaxID=112248 RepID=A0A1M4VJM4_9BACL|nr:pyridoxamine 5'-phosphate oxidase family protein [Seinonella peptonophila]SHE69179.1 Pyridoxamine 5'-phosphate oxidase [Seinonella peptonophila]